MTSERKVAAPALSVEGISVEWGGFRVLNDVSFSTTAGTLIGVVGPNGAGKTTLFNVISGVIPNYTGRVLLHGADADRSKGVLAYVPQRERVNWRFPLNVSEVVMLGRSQRIGLFRRPGKQDRDAVESSLRRVGLWEQRSALVAELSGGQRQRVFVARALAQEAEIILLDEAFSGVDVGSQEGLVSVLQELRDDGKVVLIATHDLTNLAQRFDEVLCLNHHVCAFGPPEIAFTEDVLEELYGSHGVEFVGRGAANGGG